MVQHDVIEELRETIDSPDRSASCLRQHSRSFLVLFTDLVAARSDNFCTSPLASGIDFDKLASESLVRVPINEVPPLLLRVLPWSAPEAFLPLGFDAVRYATEPLVARSFSLSNDFEGVDEEMMNEFFDLDLSVVGPLFSRHFHTHVRSCSRCRRALIEIILTGPEYRSTSGAWVNVTGLLDIVIPLADTGATMPSREWAKHSFKKIVENAELAPANDSQALIALPGLWRPDTRGVESELMVIPELLSSIQAERISLADIPWRRLEELVAELLRSRGMKVYVTPRSGDGGRDIIARGELIPGEPSVLAVEVKQKPVVGLQDLRAALWANRQFPALLFATSGRFTAGVLKEKRREENNLRLVLKDGLSLGQWIDSYINARAGSLLRSS